MFTGLFLLFMLLPAGVKDPGSGISHASAHKRLFSELSCAVQIQRLLHDSEPKLSHNKESTASVQQAVPKSLHLALIIENDHLAGNSMTPTVYTKYQLGLRANLGPSEGDGRIPTDGSETWHRLWQPEQAGTAHRAPLETHTVLLSTPETHRF